MVSSVAATTVAAMRFMKGRLLDKRGQDIQFLGEVYGNTRF
jgi:hypothetical protein